MDVVATVAIAFWAMLPAYVPNNVAVLAGGGRPIDAGHTWGGRRVLGDGKTWRGTLVGIFAGVVSATTLNAIRPAASDALGLSLPPFPLAAMLALPAGALLGDILASFVKRRTGRPRGAVFPVLDQLDFVVAAFVLTALVAPVWFTQTFTPGVLVTVLVLTPVLHVLTNVAAYWIGLKREPW